MVPWISAAMLCSFGTGVGNRLGDLRHKTGATGGARPKPSIRTGGPRNTADPPRPLRLLNPDRQRHHGLPQPPQSLLDSEWCLIVQQPMIPPLALEDHLACEED